MHRVQVLPLQTKVLKDQRELLAMKGGIRAGKTVTAAHWMHDRMETYPKARHYAVGADMPQLKRGFVRTFMIELAKMGIEHRFVGSHTFYGEHVLIEHNQARLELLSADVEQRIRSSEFDSVLCEEPQTWNKGEDVYQVVIGRMSGSPEAHVHYPEMTPQLRMSFNPRTCPIGSWLWSLIEEKKRPDGSPALPCETFSVRQNFLLLKKNPHYIELQQSQLPEHLWAVELDGEWPTFGGSVYRYYLQQWHDPNGVTSDGKRPFEEAVMQGLPQFAFDTTKPIRWTFDFNVGYQCSLVTQMHTQLYKKTAPLPQSPFIVTQRVQHKQALEVDGYQHRIFYFLDEIRLQDKGADEVCDTFIAQWGAKAKACPGVILYGDRSGGSHLQSNLTNYGIIQQKLDRAGIKWQRRVQNANPPVDDRIGIFNMQLKNADGIGMLIDHGRCPNFIKDLQAVKYKENLRGDIDKDSNKELTHMCLIGETLISTEYGLKPIKDVIVGEKVWTRNGLQYVTASGCTKRDATLLRVEFSNGSLLDLTPNHPVYIEGRGFVRAARLKSGDKCIIISPCIRLDTMGEPIRGVRASAIGNRAGVSRLEPNISTETYGKMPMVQSPRDTMCITSMETRKIMPSKISNVCLQVRTLPNIESRAAHGVKSAPRMGTWRKSRSLLKNGIEVKLDMLGTCSRRKEYLVERIETRENRFAHIAGKSTKQRNLLKRSFADGIVRPRRGAKTDVITRQEHALTAELSLSVINTPQPSIAGASVLRVIELEKTANVYDLTVEIDHEFFANGVLVSNSDAAGYMIWMEEMRERQTPVEYLEVYER